MGRRELHDEQLGSALLSEQLRSAVASGDRATAREVLQGLASDGDLTAVGLFGVPAHALAWDPGTFSGGSESQLISLQNQARASAGLKSLKASADLRTIARWRSKPPAK